GLVLVTHGRLAAEFITAMEHVVGPQEAIAGICIEADDDMEARHTDIADAIQQCDQGQGVIILTDLFGGTPSNLAISLMKSENVEVIAGVNLPMLIRLEGARKAMGVRAAVAAAREAGRKYISVASEILGEAAA
ncbi:MAG: PTS sugar transporter subunit IIA, partial [Sphingomicrobium sp.]